LIIAMRNALPRLLAAPTVAQAPQAVWKVDSDGVSSCSLHEALTQTDAGWYCAKCCDRDRAMFINPSGQVNIPQTAQVDDWEAPEGAAPAGATAEWIERDKAIRTVKRVVGVWPTSPPTVAEECMKACTMALSALPLVSPPLMQVTTYPGEGPRKQAADILSYDFHRCNRDKDCDHCDRVEDFLKALAAHAVSREASVPQGGEACPNGRHVWPPDYGDGDTCDCGKFYLFVHSDDGGPRVVESV
jgi:hypothetical protein